MFTLQTQPQAPRSGIIQEYKDKMEGVKKLHGSDTLLDGSSNDNDSFSKQITDSNTTSIVGSKHNSPKSSPSITAVSHSADEDENKDSNNNLPISSVEKQEIAEDDHEHTTELSDSIFDDSIFGDYDEISFRDLYNSNIHDIRLDEMPLLDDALCQLKDRVGRIITSLGDYRVEETNSTEKAKEFVDMIFDNIESVKTEKEIEELNKKYVPQFNITFNKEMNLYDLYRMYHCDIPLLKAKSIIPYYPDDESFEKKLLYRVLPEAMKKGVIDSLERKLAYGIFELPARARIDKIRNSIKQKQELSRLDRILNDPGLSSDQLLKI